MKYVFSLVLFALSFSSDAVWLNTGGKVTGLITYAHTETILVTISNPGADVAECSSKGVFAISSSVSEEARTRMYAMLLSAQATGRNVTISYNDVGNCEPWERRLTPTEELFDYNNSPQL